MTFAVTMPPEGSQICSRTLAYATHSTLAHKRKGKAKGDMDYSLQNCSWPILASDIQRPNNEKYCSSTLKGPGKSLRYHGLEETC